MAQTLSSGGVDPDSPAAAAAVGGGDAAVFEAARQQQDRRAAKLRSKRSDGGSGRKRSGRKGGYNDDDAADSALYAAIFSGVLGRSTILRDVRSLAAVHALLPGHQQVNDWALLFCNNSHGSSLKTFSRLCAQKGATLLLIEDTSGARFGGYAPVRTYTYDDSPLICC